MTNMVTLSAPFQDGRLSPVACKGTGVATKGLAHAGGGNRQSISCLSTAGQFSSSQKENNIRRTAPHPSPYHYHRSYLDPLLRPDNQHRRSHASLPRIRIQRNPASSIDLSHGYRHSHGHGPVGRLVGHFADRSNVGFFLVPWKPSFVC